MGRAEETPLMQQWREAKSRHPDAIVFIRVGDFYEMFYDDAEEGARLLGLTLTSRNNGGAANVPLAGVPARAKDEYLQRLIRLGRRVAVCEQVEDPAEAKGIVRREVVETVTPGAILADALLSERRNNFLLALSEDRAGRVGLAAVDASTGEVRGAVCEASEIEVVLARFEPAEVVLPQSWSDRVSTIPAASRTSRPDWMFDPEIATDELKRRYSLISLDGLGFQEGDDALVGALGALLAYLAEVQPSAVEALQPPRIERMGESMALDEMTRRNLELVEPLRPDLASKGARAATLIEVLDETLTGMGARLLRQWLLRPLIVAEPIWARQESVAELFERAPVRRAVRVELKEIRDLGRLAGKVATGRVLPRELKALEQSLSRIPQLKKSLTDCSTTMLRAIAEMDALDDACALIAGALADDLPATLGEGDVMRTGHDAELDELRAMRDGATGFIAALQARERERTGIASLKVGYNKVFGYFLEVTRTHMERVPADYERKQTLANAERYVTPELKQLEEKVLNAEEKIGALELRLFQELRRRVAAELPRLQSAADQIATLDVLTTLAHVAERNGYVRPIVHSGYDLEIRAGRHPVVETMMPREDFIPNDIVLNEDRRIVLLTGPNMAGKSTYLRACALIVLLAQVGAFVPARFARIPVCDRVFTRVGASDNLARGQSTFMVEMSETASILHSATARSLVLLDEIGRGTATYDGVSIAWAVTEYLHSVTGAKALFATHYHELTQLPDALEATTNASMGVKEVGHEIVFLHNIQDGPASRSYGVDVARLAGIPSAVIARAREILHELEGAHQTLQHRVSDDSASHQLSLFAQTETAVSDKIRRLELDRMTPIQALNVLAEIRQMVDDARIS